MSKNRLIDDLRWALRRAEQDSEQGILEAVFGILAGHDTRPEEEQAAGLASRERRFWANVYHMRGGKLPPVDWDAVPERTICADDGSVYVQATLLGPDNGFKSALRAEMIMDTSSSYWRIHGWQGAPSGVLVYAYDGRPEDGIEPLARTVTTDYKGSPMVDLAVEAEASPELQAALDAGDVWFVLREQQ